MTIRFSCNGYVGHRPHVSAVVDSRYGSATARKRLRTPVSEISAGPSGDASIRALMLAVLLGAPSAAFAQSEANAPAQSQGSTRQDVVVTATRIGRAGFEAPTPTTVLSAADILQGNKVDIAQSLNEFPQFRGTSSPTTNPANTNAGSTAADLRGLGVNRTLTLLNGHRFIGGATDLNQVPLRVIDRVDVVTGGASAAWGSGAVAGVVNIILNDRIDGVILGADSGISTRGDGMRSSLNATYGRGFASDRGHLTLSAEYLDQNGIFGRNNGDRPNLDSSLFTTTTGQLSLQNDVNFRNATTGGIITSGPLAGQLFNPNGTLSPLIVGSPSNATDMVGGNSRSQSDYYPIASQYKRYNIYGRLTYDISDAAKIWIDGTFSRVTSAFAAYPEVIRSSTTSGLLIRSDNAFLSPTVRAALGGTTGFYFGRIFADVGPQRYHGNDQKRDTVEGAIGIDGSLGDTWKYDAYYDHGEYRNRSDSTDQRITANLVNAVDAVLSPTTGQPVCRIALTNPTTTCSPINLFGEGNISPAAVAYAFGDATSVYTTKLDATGVSLRGEPFSLWAGPVSIAIGAEARWESVRSSGIDAISAVGGFALQNYTPLSGSFSVKEGFAEVAVPVVEAGNFLKIDLNGAARYSDYSNSGGIWSWKAGGTARILNDLRLRAVYSRDIRSPTITELYSTRGVGIGNISDPFRGGAVSPYISYTGGNPDLKPEIAHTLTLGGAYTPSWIPGLNLSVDSYRITIDGVVGTLSAQDAVNQCFAGNAVACSTITRDSAGAISSLVGSFINLAYYKTTGIDFEISYRLPVSQLFPSATGSIQLHGLATYVDKLVINDGVNIYDRAGDVGNGINFTTPHWKATQSIAYQGTKVGLNARVRYVGGGRFNHLLNIANNDIASRTYVDLGASIDLGALTLRANVENVFDRDPPFVTYASAIYDQIGRYFSLNAKVKF